MELLSFPCSSDTATVGIFIRVRAIRQPAQTARWWHIAAEAKVNGRLRRSHRGVDLGDRLDVVEVLGEGLAPAADGDDRGAGGRGRRKDGLRSPRFVDRI